MAPLNDNNPTKMTAADGSGSEVGRRLSDKILSAFSHAYAVGESEIAKQLKTALEANEQRRGDEIKSRAEYDPLGQAEKWVLFVEARNAYKIICNTHQEDSPKALGVLEEMKSAYRLWSMS